MNRDQLRSLARELKGLGVKEAFGYGLSTDLSKSELEADLQDCVREIHVAGRAAEFEKKLTKGQAREAWNELSSEMKALKAESPKLESTKESRAAAARVLGVARPEPEEEEDEPKEITVEEALEDEYRNEVPPEPVAEEKPKRAKACRITEDMTISIVEAKAPKREGTIAWANFEQYRKHPLVKDFLEKSGVDRPRAALAFDRFHGRIILK